ncbi:MAG: 1-deoxy-D-xylulose-5-phosphate synthase N-terminal domain-containing protein [Alistipes finegoldii]
MGHQTMPTRSSRAAASVQTKRRLGASAASRACPREYDAFGGGRLGVDLGGLRHGQGGRTAGREYRVVAVIGGSSMTGGLAFEGLNNAGASKRQPAGDSERQHGDRSGHGRAETTCSRFRL